MIKKIDLATSSEESIIQEACAVLRAGGLLVYPTETVYGLGVDATNPEAVAKLLAFKTRREGKPLSIAVTSQEMASEYAVLTPQAQTMYAKLLPGPVTIVSQAKPSLAPGVASEFGTIGVRIPAYPLIVKIVAAFGKPITATSANASGKKRPYSFEDIWQPLSNKQQELLDLMIDAGTLPPTDPSVVIDTTTDTPLTLREASHSVLLQDWLKTRDGKSVIETSSPEATQDLAGKIMLRNWENIKTSGLIIGLDGPLGAGKTVFAQGIAKFLQIQEPLTSPTYTFLESYEWQRHNVFGTLHHLDLWKVADPDQLSLLKIPDLVKPGGVVLIEWFGQFGSLLLPEFEKKGATVVHCSIEDLSGTERSCTIQ